MKRPMPHEYAALFPMASESELAEMAKDIKARGLLNPIILHEGKVLDGRNRLEACDRAGVNPTFVDYEGTDALADVLSWNLHRRHLDASQRAMVGAKLANMTKADAGRLGGKAAHDQATASLQSLVSQSAAAKAVNVSPRLIADAKAVQKEAPDLAKQVEAGKLTVHAAKKQVEARKESAAEAEESAYLEGNETEQEEQPIQKEEPKPKRGMGVQYANEAIAVLQKIRPDDPLRKVGLDTVVQWIKANR